MICSKCKQDKPLTEFSKRYGRAKGLRSWCKDCYRENRRKYVASHRKKIATYRRRYHYEHKEEHNGRSHNYSRSSEGRIAQQKYRIANPKKIKARSVINNATAAGKLIRPSICQVCSAETFIEAHHFDYGAPLEVEWLCRDCHQKLHNEELEYAH